MGIHTLVTFTPYKNTDKFTVVEKLKYPHTQGTYIKPILVLSRNHDVPTGSYNPGNNNGVFHFYLVLCT